MTPKDILHNVSNAPTLHHSGTCYCLVSNSHVYTYFFHVHKAAFWSNTTHISPPLSLTHTYIHTHGSSPSFNIHINHSDFKPLLSKLSIDMPQLGQSVTILPPWRPRFNAGQSTWDFWQTKWPDFSSSTSDFPPQYHSTNTPHSFLYQPGTGKLGNMWEQYLRQLQIWETIMKSNEHHCTNLL